MHHQTLAEQRDAQWPEAFDNTVTGIRKNIKLATQVSMALAPVNALLALTENFKEPWWTIIVLTIASLHASEGTRLLVEGTLKENDFVGTWANAPGNRPNLDVLQNLINQQAFPHLRKLMPACQLTTLITLHQAIQLYSQGKHALAEILIASVILEMSVFIGAHLAARGQVRKNFAHIVDQEEIPSI